MGDLRADRRPTRRGRKKHMVVMIDPNVIDFANLSDMIANIAGI
jgi:hypothetical protein